MDISPIELEVYKNLLSEVAEEMGSTLSRTAFSPNIKERRDYSCAIFDGNGDLAAQALHIPVHLGSMPHSVRHAIQSIELRSGDVAILSDRRELPPYGLAGGRNGSKGRNRLIHSTGHEDLPGKVNFTAEKHDIISIQTPGGGGWGEEGTGSKT